MKNSLADVGGYLKAKTMIILKNQNKVMITMKMKNSECD